ncbi:Rhoptry kinase family protein ROP23 (incomplete catalytic triad), putative [Eimeria maxima]|uniref:Rhoptry kinase family protein ROP23 (Incomplete catalytic triad), putative n=1 Tax=Eimeria maxima TaxID=5804 RepID=U6MDY3_EIMMA|nr:Rhoptry kinase family protein ROP23 (incomplete catalytic triad), putative [Eimeria maxima]CDJ60649.1 Rhoptry kinase family protein ROP23 (incomplete catalytic triad), putative [Eimeria maxima]
MARAWRKILPLAAILAFELVSHVLIISPCPALAIENGEGQSLVDPQLQPADFENEEGQRTDNLGEAASESQQLILREGVESSTPSLRGTTVLRELGEKELGVAMPASTLTVPYATMSVPAVAATPMTTGVIADGAVGGGLFQKMKTLKSYLGLMKYAKYANVAGYNTYGTFSNAYPMVADYGPAAATFASFPSKGYNGYNTYAGNNNYTGFSAPTENIGGLGKKTRFTEEPGQRYLAQVLSKNRTGWWLSNKVSKLVDILGGVLPQGVDQPALLSNGYETREAVFLAVLQNRERFVDLLVQDQLLQEEQPLQRQWIGRMYTEVKGQYSAIQALDRDFTIAKMAPQNQPLASFRHSLRLDIPIDLYEFSGLDTYVQAPDGQVFLNAISRRPLIRATAETVMANAGSSRRAYKALLSLSQQAVRAVANLNCIMMVHTNINPASFLVTEKGLVFLGGLFQATQQGSSLANNYKFTLTTPVFLPPELRDNASYYSMQALPSQDAWQLGMTLFTFWCSQLTVDSAGGLNFSNCISCMPAEIKDLIMGLTQIDPNSRLLAENVALKHPAMLLPIYPDIPPQADVNQDDEPYLDFF